MATPGIKQSGTVAIPGLKGRAAVTVAFRHGAWTSWKFGQLPVGYRPQKSVTAVVYSYPSAALIQASTDGNLYFATRDSAMQTGQNLDGTLTFVRA